MDTTNNNGATATATATQAAKPAVKRTRKPAEKAAPAKASKGASFFIAGNRPGSGSLLKAHTAAFLGLYDMLKGKGAPLATARKVMGDTAINYHCTNARMVKKDGQVFLTPAGISHFGARNDSLDSEAVKAYASVMTSGKPDGRFVKNPADIAKIA